jgi:hypothetical protein
LTQGEWPAFEALLLLENESISRCTSSDTGS